MSVIGLRVGPYEIVEPAEVPETGPWFLARRTAHNRKQPIEILVRLMTHDADEQERASLQNYFERLRTLEDARIPQAVGYFEGIGAVAIECVRGISLACLAELINDNSIEIPHATTLDLILDISEAILHAHNRGLVHGCLSLDSIVMGDTGQIWIFGFGLGPSEPVSAGWISPERVAGEAATAHTDQWSIAAIAATLITGELPWRDDAPPSASETTQIIHTTSQHWPGLCRVLKPMLESNPAHRYENLQRARQELLALSRNQNSRANRREFARKLHLLFQEPATYDSFANLPVDNSHLAPPTMPLDSQGFATPPGAPLRSKFKLDSLVDDAINLVEEELLSTLMDSDDHDIDYDGDPPSAPGGPTPLSDNHRASLNISNTLSKPTRKEHNTLSDEIDVPIHDTVVPASDPDEFNIQAVANVSFTNPGNEPEIGDLGVVEQQPPTDEVFPEESLPTLDLDMQFINDDLPPRTIPTIVKLTPWLAVFAVVIMGIYLLAG